MQVGFYQFVAMPLFHSESCQPHATSLLLLHACFVQTTADFAMVFPGTRPMRDLALEAYR